MLLTIDVGNTNMVFGLFEGKNLVGSFPHLNQCNLDFRRDRYADFAVLSFSEDRSGKNQRGHHRIGRSARDVFAQKCNSQILRIHPLVVGKDVDTGMVNHYNNPREVGVDRLVNGVSAWRAMESP